MARGRVRHVWSILKPVGCEMWGLDRNLMSTVVRREVPQWWRPEEAHHCLRASHWLSWKRGHLRVEDDCGERRVPAMCEREDIVKFTAQ